MVSEVDLTKEIPFLRESCHDFLALLGNHGDLALAVDDEKDGILPNRPGGFLFRSFDILLWSGSCLLGEGTSRSKSCCLLVFMDETLRWNTCRVRACIRLLSAISFSQNRQAPSGRGSGLTSNE